MRYEDDLEGSPDILQNLFHTIQKRNPKLSIMLFSLRTCLWALSATQITALAVEPSSLVAKRHPGPCVLYMANYTCPVGTFGGCCTAVDSTGLGSSCACIRKKPHPLLSKSQCKITDLHQALPLYCFRRMREGGTRTSALIVSGPHQRTFLSVVPCVASFKRRL
jgi:hypothetical protein